MLVPLTLAIGVLWNYLYRKDFPLRMMISPPPRLGRFHHQRTRLVSLSDLVQCIHLPSIHPCHQSCLLILGSRRLYHDNLVPHTVQRETISLYHLIFHLEVQHEARLDLAGDLRSLTQIASPIRHLTHTNRSETGLMLLRLRLEQTNYHDLHSKNYRIPQLYQRKNCMTDLNNTTSW